MSTRQVRRHLTRLREDYRLIDRVQKGGSRNKYADVYQLVLPDDLAERVELTDDPELRRGRPADRVDNQAESVDGAGDNPPVTGPSTPELRTSRAGTPDISCSNSGHMDVRPPTTTPPTTSTSVFSPYGAEVEVPSPDADEGDLDYSSAFKIISRVPERMEDYVDAVKAEAAVHGLDPPTGAALTIAVARLALAEHPHLAAEGRTHGPAPARPARSG
ncbi:hypothetical protein AB0C08_28225 [Microbispora bryophytorum]